MKFLLGCNYWDSAHGTDMWKYYDREVIKEDIKALADIGVKCMRVFPNWREFQPVKRLYQWRMKPCDCVAVDEQPLEDDTGVDKNQIENFRHFASVCEEYGIDLIVAVMTGWMSGRVFAPPIVDGRNLINDPEALMWTDRFIRGFVSQVKDIPNIIMWDLGNECNCLGPTESRAEAYVWTAFVRNAIKAADPTREISSGMHGLDGDEAEGVWTIRDQGEITDYVTTHPYVSPSVNNDYDAPNKMRSTIFPTVQSMYYQDLGRKPVIMQEQNAFSETTANREAAADFMRVNFYSCLAHNIKGYLWWCAHEHIHLDASPYAWSMMERSLGLVDLERKPKPIGKEMKNISAIIDELPFDELPQHEIDTVCVLTKNDRWANGSVSFVLAKQAGLDMKFCNGDVSGLYPPDASVYVVPGVFKWAIMYKHTWEFLKRKVYEDGASMLVTYDGGSLIELGEVFGLRPNGNIRSQKNHVGEFEFGKLEYYVNQELLLESVGAKVLATNETGNIVFSEHQYGKGKVFFLNMPLEVNLSCKAGVFNQTDWYKIYQKVGEDTIAKKLVVSTNPQIGITVHKETDERYIICAINYSDVAQETCLKVQEGWVLSEIHGSLLQIDKCTGAFYYATRK
ncbi:MAG: cellulase family glycosylhydrolase [Tyzzerella sp.]|nr:cellulase family glycosylhydrolase [Tyzzerella sp.]